MSDEEYFKKGTAVVSTSDDQIYLVTGEPPVTYSKDVMIPVSLTLDGKSELEKGIKINKDFLRVATREDLLRSMNHLNLMISVLSKRRNFLSRIRNDLGEMFVREQEKKRKGLPSIYDK